MIYLIRQNRHIKIGVSADPWRRVTDFQTAAPQRLEVLAIAPGDRAMERELHLLFAADRTGGSSPRRAGCFERRPPRVVIYFIN